MIIIWLFSNLDLTNFRCVVRTLAAPEVIRQGYTLDFDNCSLYKDFCLVNWQVEEAYRYNIILLARTLLTTYNLSSYANVTRLDSHFINLVNEEVTQVQ